MANGILRRAKELEVDGVTEFDPIDFVYLRENTELVMPSQFALQLRLG